MARTQARSSSNIHPGDGSALASYDPQWTMLGGALLFAANDGATGVELWRSDGTTQGTQRVMDLRPGADGSQPRRFITAGNRIFFTASLSETSHALWVSDGTPEGTLPLRTFEILGEMFVRSNGNLLFSASTTRNNLELWQSDGTANGTALVADINPGLGNSDPTRFFEKAPNVVLFSADDGLHGRELWSTDGTAGYTFMIKDISTGPLSSSPVPMTIVTTTILGDGGSTSIERVLLRVPNAQNKWELWATDGLPDGIVQHTQRLYIGGDRYSVAPPTVLGMQTVSVGNYLIDQAVLSMADVKSRGGVWASDGTATGTQLISDKAAPSVSEKKSVAQFGGLFFYPANDLVTGNELWRSAGTAPSTIQVADVFAGDKSSFPRDLTVLGQRLFFTADTGARGRELYSGDVKDATLVKDVWPGPTAGVSRILGTAQGVLYFVGNDGATGDELWKSDGTEAGTVMVKNLALDVGGISVSGDGFAALGDKLVFGVAEQLAEKSKLAVEATTTTTQAISAASAITPALWVSDGTADGTTALKTFAASNESGRTAAPHEFTALNDGVLFIGGDGPDVAELWRTDGTVAGTRSGAIS